MDGSEQGWAGEIVQLRADDAQALCPLSIEAGWNQVAADWRLMLTLGRGFGARDTRGGWIGSALTLPLGPELSWISMVLVTLAARGKGLGTRLLSCCIEAVEASGRVAGLDATEFGRPIYLPLGFRDVFPLSRWHAQSSLGPAVDAPAGVAIHPAGLRDLQSITAWDSARSGFSRELVLNDLLSRTPHLAHVARTGNGALVGFVLGRGGYRTWHIGPLIADDEMIALSLLSAAATAVDGSLIVDVPDHHRQLRLWQETRGATAPRRFMRMMRSAKARLGDHQRVFALAGPELG